MANNEYDQFLEEDYGISNQASDGNEYDQLLDDQGTAQRRNAQLNIRSAQEADPKRTIEALKLSQEYNVPPDFAEKNFEILNKKRQASAADYDQIIDESPALAEWLQKPENARLAKNDLPKLGGIEQQTRRFRAEKANPITIHKEYLRAGKGGLRQLESSAYLIAAAYGKADTRLAAEAVAESSRAQSNLREDAPGYVKEFDKILAEESGDVNAAWNKLTSGYSDIKKRNILDGLKKFGTGSIQTVGESLDLIYESIINNPRAVGYMTVESLANSFPSLVGGAVTGAGGAAAGSVIPVVGTAAGAAAGFVGGTFVGSSFVEIGASIQEEMSERGIDLSDADAVEVALKNPDLMADVKARAERKGLTTAAVDAAFSLFAGQAVAKSGKGFFKTAKAVSKDVGVQAVGEATSEAAGQLAREEGDLTKIDLGQAIAEGVISLGHSAGEVIVGGAGRAARSRLSKDPVKAAEQVTDDAAKALKTMKDLEALEKTLFEARELQDVGQAPDKIKELIDLTTGGDEGQSIFFQADDFKNYWDRKGKSPIEEAERLLKGGAKALQESAITGTPVETTAGKFIAEMAAQKENDDILGIARTSPDGGTLKEAQQVMADLPAVMEQLADEAINEVDVSEDFEKQAKEVGQNVEQQLRAAGQVGMQAKTNAALSEAVFSTLAKRSGIPARELFEKYGLKIRGPEQIGQVTEGQQTFEQQPVTFDDEEGIYRIETDQVKASGDFIADPAEWIQEFINPEGVYDQEIDIAQFGLDQAERPFIIESIQVIQDQRGQGIGTDAMQSLEQEAIKQGADFILLNASPMGTSDKTSSLPKLIKFYESLGYQVIRRSEGNAEMFKKVEPQRPIAPITKESFGKFQDKFKKLDDEGYTFKVSGDDPMYVLAFDKAGERVGQAIISRDPVDKVMTVNRVDVNEADQRKGIASRLYSEALNYAKNNFYKNPDYTIINKDINLTEQGKLLRQGIAGDDRLQRAEAAGFDTSKTFYHATTADFSEFKVNPKGVNTYGEGIYFSDKSFGADRFGKGGESRTIEVYLKDDKPIDLGDKVVNNRPVTLDQVYSDLGIEESKLPSSKKLGPENGAINNYRKLLYSYKKANNIRSDKQGKSELRKALINAGYTSFHTIDADSNFVNMFDPKNIRSVDAEFKDPSSAKILAQGGGRGRIRFGADRQFNIDLLKGADPSTFPHELAHFFLEVMGDLAETDGVPQDIKDDYRAVLDWFGVESRTDIGVDQHEQWARGFEAYLMEGKAPTSKLKKMFARFRQWLTAVYRNIRNLNVELTPEIRDVFNRMLATEQEIAEANSTGDFDPMFSDPTAFGMTGKKAERYMKAVEDARFAAEDQLLAKIMDGHTRKRTSAYKEERARVKEQVTKEIDDSNLYKALALLQRGTKPDGSALDENTVPFKLDRKALVDSYGADFVKNRLPKPFVYAREDGMHHDIAAEILGFESGDDLVTQIANAVPRKEAIERRTDVIMGEKYKDLLADDSQLEAEALVSIHNDKRAQLLRLELEHIIENDLPTFKEFTRRTIKFPPPDKFIKAEAQRIIGNRKIGQIRPNIFLAAQRRARQEAAKSWGQGDRDAVYSAKMRELLNHYMYAESVKFQDKLRKDQAKFKKIFASDKDIGKNRDINFVKAARAVLAAFGLGRSTTTPQEHLEQMRAYDPEGYETVKVLVDNAIQKANPYKDISMNDYEDMSEAVFALWDLSKRSKEIEIDGKKVDLDLAKDEIISQLDQSTKKKVKLKYDEDADKWDKTRAGLLGTKAMLRRMEHWVSAMDLGNINGAFRKYLWTPVSEASDRYTLVSAQLKKSIAAEAQKIKPRMTQEPILAPEINFKFQNKSQLMGALLHIGNTSNKAKLLVGRGWGSINEDGSLNTKRWDQFLNRMFSEGIIGKPEMDFIQFVWDKFESLKPMAQKAHKELNGYYFNEITSEEFETPFGKYRGGYAPAQIDPTPPKQGAARAYGVADKQKVEELSQMATSSYTWPAAGGNGFTKSRVTNFNKPLLLDINLINRHIDQVARFAIIKPAVVDAAKVILQPDVRAAITDIDPTIINEMIIPSLSRADKQRIQTLEGQGPAFVAKFANYFRTTASMQLMFLSVNNTAEQLTGFFPALLRVNAKQLTTAAAQFIKAPRQTADLIAEKSQAMKVRFDKNLFEYTKQMRDVFDDPNGLEKMQDFANKHMYVSQTYLQNFMDIVVWQGSYNQAIESGVGEKEAIRTADRDVRETQSTIRPVDISRAESNPLLRVFQMFMGFFNNLANLNVTEFRNVYYSDLGLKEKYARGLYTYLMGFAMLGIGSSLVKLGLSGGDLDEDDDGYYVDDALEVLFGSQVRLLTAMVPVAGPAIQAGINKGNDKYFDDRVSASPAITAITGVVGTPVEISKKLIDGKEIKSRDIKDAMTATGVLLGLPIGPAGKPVGYLYDVKKGEARPTGPIDFARGLVTGKAGDN